jgi:hypothetical protein
MSTLLSPPHRLPAAPASRHAVTSSHRIVRRILLPVGCLILAGCAAGSLPPPNISLQAHVASASAMIDQIGNNLDETPSAPDAEAVALYALALQEADMAIALAEERREAASQPMARIISADILASAVACRTAILRLRALHDQAQLTREVFDLGNVGRTCAMAGETDALLTSAREPRR